MPLTPRQAQVLELIRAHLAATGAPPTRAEIAQALGFASPNAAEAHLKALARKGAVALRPGAARGIQVLWADAAGAPSTTRPVAEGVGGGLSIIGRVAAGSPLLARENIEGRLGLDPGAFSPRADYLLRVQGASMRDAGILDGDLLAVHRTPVAENGQIVVARLMDMEDEVTVKRFERRGDTVVLHPANPDFAPIRVDLRRRPLDQALAIEGRGVGVLRRGLLP